jgi:hypothetical protein
MISSKRSTPEAAFGRFQGPQIHHLVVRWWVKSKPEPASVNLINLDVVETGARQAQ